MGDSTYIAAPNLRAPVADDAEYAYRDAGPRDDRVLVMIQHLRGNLDNWDPALIDGLAERRRVITVD